MATIGTVQTITMTTAVDFPLTTTSGILWATKARKSEYINQ